MVVLRAPRLDELDAASELCLRSKAHWGYDADFMAACVEELTLTSADLAQDEVVLALLGDSLAGVAQISLDDDGCYLEKLFVAPDQMGHGIGKKLFGWGAGAAARLGAVEMIVEADPVAAGFYKAMGCTEAGFAESGSVPGRHLPRMTFSLMQSATVNP